jgi:hypothetical protein
MDSSAEQELSSLLVTLPTVLLLPPLPHFTAPQLSSRGEGGTPKKMFNIKSSRKTLNPLVTITFFLDTLKKS